MNVHLHIQKMKKRANESKHIIQHGLIKQENRDSLKIISNISRY